MGPITGWISYISFLICIALVAHAVLPWSSIARARVSPSKWSLGARFILECSALFLWLVYGLALLAWALWIGDNDHWFFHYGWIISFVIALGVSTISIVRIYRNRANARYLKLHLWTPLALLLSFVLTFGYESLSDVEGRTAESAAKAVFDRMAAKMDQPVTLVQHDGPPPHGRHPDNYKAYWIWGPDEPRGRFSISRHPWYGWRRTYTEYLPPSADELASAKEFLTDIGDRDMAILILQNMIKNYPNTPAETEAREFLESIQQSK